MVLSQRKKYSVGSGGYLTPFIWKSKLLISLSFLKKSREDLPSSMLMLEPKVFWGWGWKLKVLGLMAGSMTVGLP